ncbi:MAG: hypothetical protein AAGC92_16550 [Pseudomonadota bacterium]
MSEAAAKPKVRQSLFARVFGDLAQTFRWSFLPPLMVYLAAGVSRLTSVVGTFFVKEYLDLSAAFLAGLAFWAGLPWVLKMPLGHLVDLIWRWKALLVWLGAGVIAASLLIMYALVAETETMRAIMPLSAWYVLAMLLAPSGYVIQDVVADAMTVEAVPKTHPDGRALSEADEKALHTTMQTLGRFAILSGLVLVATINIAMFEGSEGLEAAARARLYARIFLIALCIPIISILGVLLAGFLGARGGDAVPFERSPQGKTKTARPSETGARPNWAILGGGLAFVVFSIAIGLGDPPFAQEIIFAGSMAVVLFLIRRLLRELPPKRARALIGTAAIIFVFRAVPLPGPGLGWFQIDVLGFDEQFLSVLALITSVLTLVGLILLRPMMARRSIVWIVVMLTLASALLALSNIGLVFGLDHWTAALTGGVVDARFIAILDTAAESPLGQIAMVPMLAWIARNAPDHLKATFFAVMASFTNLALSASSLTTRYANEILVVTRAQRDPTSGIVAVPADYAALGPLMIGVALVGFVAPLLAVLLVQGSRWRTTS